MIIPIFVPHKGCPNDCAFCNQRTISGKENAPSIEQARSTINDPDTLKKEYLRDVAAGVDIHLPENYFPENDPTQPPIVRWRSCAHLLYANWLNYCVYQTTPYDISEIKEGTRTV